MLSKLYNLTSSLFINLVLATSIYLILFIFPAHHPQIQNGMLPSPSTYLGIPYAVILTGKKNSSSSINPRSRYQATQQLCCQRAPKWLREEQATYLTTSFFGPTGPGPLDIVRPCMCNSYYCRPETQESRACIPRRARACPKKSTGEETVDCTAVICCCIYPTGRYCATW